MARSQWPALDVCEARISHLEGRRRVARFMGQDDLVDALAREIAKEGRKRARILDRIAEGLRRTATNIAH